MKILVLAYDGLEYDIVHNNNFPNIKQREYGKVIVPLTSIGEPSTPVVWSSFITGKSPREHGIYKPLRWRIPLFEEISQTRLLPYRHILRSILGKIGIRPKAWWRKDMISETIFDKVNPSIAVSVPLIDEDYTVWARKVYSAVVKNGYRKEFLELANRDFMETKEALFSAINKEWDFLMVHFQYPDLINHVFFRNRNKIANLYDKFEILTKEVREKVGGNVWVLVISDHGIDDSCGHSKFGFYSSNIPLDRNVTHITDFFYMFLERLDKIG